MKASHSLAGSAEINPILLMKGAQTWFLIIILALDEWLRLDFIVNEADCLSYSDSITEVLS